MTAEGGASIKQPKKLTSGQRHYLYRLGLLAVDQFLLHHGFKPNSSESSTVFSYDKNKVWLDVKLAEPGKIAYVTSIPGVPVEGKNKYGVKSKVVTASEIMGSDMLIQILISTDDSVGTRAPIYVPLPPDLEQPAQHVLKQVLGTIALACESIPKLREAFTEAEVREAQDRPIDVSALPLLPE